MWLACLGWLATAAACGPDDAPAPRSRAAGPQAEHRPEPARPDDPALRAALIRAIQGEADARYAFAAAGSRLRAEHPSQDLRVDADPAGMMLATHEGTAPIRIGLQRLNGRALPPARIRHRGSRAELVRPGVTEWYVHGPLGLEQGFTIEAPAVGAEDTLHLDVGVEADGYEVTRSSSGATVLARGGRRMIVDELFAFDADGRTLPSSMTLSDGALRIEVDATDAAYPIHVDPMWSLQDVLSASDGEADDELGRAVALSGDTALVGAPDDTTDAPGSSGEQSGSAYVFVRSGDTWTQQAHLIPSDPDYHANFGESVAIDGDTAIVGVPNHDEGGVNDTGAVYVYARSGATWSEQAKIVGTAAGDRFGFAVALSGDTALVGARGEDAAGELSSGAAYVLTRSGTTWSEQARLVAEDASEGDAFGRSVSLDGDTALIGAPYDVGGSAYVFVNDGTGWAQQSKLTGSGTALYERFGTAVSLSGDTALISEPRNESGATSNPGSVYVFVRSGTSWTEQAQLFGSDDIAGNYFGESVSLQGDTALIGAPLEGDIYGIGSAYVFVRSGTTWTEQKRWYGHGMTSLEARLGFSVSLDADTALVGAFNDETGISDTPTGAAYVFVVRAEEGESCGASGECSSGYCVDGVCCDAPCGGGSTDDCQACVAAQTGEPDGTCAPVTAGTPCGDATETPCDGADTCDGSGACQPNIAADGSACDDGAFCSTDSSCMSGACVGNDTDPCASDETCNEATDACLADCGNGDVDEGEECDDGDDNSDTMPGACRTSCELPACGDGVVDPGEECDDGEAGSATCTSSCTVPDEEDAGVPDAGRPDAGVPDAGRADAGRPDAGVPDAGRADAGAYDASRGSDSGAGPGPGASDGGCSCRVGVEATTTGWPVGLAVLLVPLALRRRRSRRQRGPRKHPGHRRSSQA